jgi:hypothetical protein
MTQAILKPINATRMKLGDSQYLRITGEDYILYYIATLSGWSILGCKLPDAELEAAYQAGVWEVRDGT